MPTDRPPNTSCDLEELRGIADMLASDSMTNCGSLVRLAADEIERLRAALDRKNFALSRAADRLGLIAGLRVPGNADVHARWSANALAAFKAEPTLSPEAAKPLIDEEIARG